MADQGDPLARIANALEQMAPARQRAVDWASHPGYAWHQGRVRPVAQLDALPLDRLKGIDRQKQAMAENIRRHAQTHAAHDMLLWGARGTGKSALLRAAVAAAAAEFPGTIALIQIDSASLVELPDLFAAIAQIPRQFVVYLDDLAFDHADDAMLRDLRSALDGGLAPRPGNIRLAVTSNHRSILARGDQDQAGPLNQRDWMDDSLALADRFGLRLGFHPCDQDDYLAIVAAHATAHGLNFDRAAAIEWAAQRGQRSGRTAWQFVVELAGQAGKAI